jgi:uroporphyrinogen-III synthase
LSRPLLLVTRPAEEAGRTAAAAGAAGFETLLAPLLTIAPVDFAVPAGAFDALLFTSARAPGLVAERAPGLLAVPAYAVGARTGEELAAAGFRLAGLGETDGSAVLAQMAGLGVRRVLHLAGEATAPIHVPGNVELVRVRVYAALRVAALPAAALTALSAGRVFATLLFSARTARHFRHLADAAGVDVAGQRIVALSHAVADGAGAGWAAVGVARVPDIDAALAAARLLWQGIGHERAEDGQ